MINVRLQKRIRIDAIDILRGLCIILMLADHFMFIVLKANPIKNIASNENWNNLVGLCYKIFTGNVRNIIRPVVICTFFVISGICCFNSRNNFKRGIKLAIVALLITILTYTISFVTPINICVDFGVIHFYAVAILMWSAISSIHNDKFKIFLVLMLFIFSLYIYIVHPKIDNNALLAIGIPSVDYIYHMDYFPVFPWISVFLVGALIGELIFSKERLLLQENNSRNKLLTPFRLIGQNGLKVYMGHLPILIAIIMAI